MTDNGERAPCPFHGPDCVADPREGQDFDWPGENAHSPLPAEHPCSCGHAKDEHRRRMDECLDEGCFCPLWRPAHDPDGAEDATPAHLFGVDLSGRLDAVDDD